jgi:hypothetical protein
MSSIRIPIPSEQLAAQVLSQIPEETRISFRKGYSLLAKLSPEKQQKVLSRSIESLEEQSLSLSSADLQKELGFNEHEMESLLGAMMLLTSGVAAQASGKAKEEVVAELAKAKMIEAEDVSKIEAIYSSLKARGSEFENRMERSQLASRIFPAYRRTRTAVDLRVGSGEKRVAVVVGLVHIDTDTRDESIEFQTTSSQLGKLIKLLQDLQRDMEEAGKLVSVWEKK